MKEYEFSLLIVKKMNIYKKGRPWGMDNLVYKLYNLTPEEIKIVEEKLTNHRKDFKWKNET